MRVFHCDRCAHLLFFENSACMACRAALAFVPEAVVIASHPGDLAAGTWRATHPSIAGRSFRLCRNYTDYQICNWAVAADDAHVLCRSCRLTRLIPDVSQTEQRIAWYRLEVAKRRLIFTLMALGLAPFSDDDPASGLAFEFKSDPADPAAPRVLTGHDAGVITVNVAEADDAERERRRHGLGEPHRTLLGHMRHESGHYFWDRLVRGTGEQDGFRALFGDEQNDYGEALNRHYHQGPPQDWPRRFVTSYASAHPWEDWAETWAHYLHMVDALETVADNGLVLTPKRSDEPALPKLPRAVTLGRVPFDRLIQSWFALTYVLNNLNRSLGQPDGYPFVLSSPAVDKLRFVHDLVGRAAAR